MSNVSKISEFLDKAGTFMFLTTDGDQPKGGPFGFHMVVNDKLYFGCGTFKNVFKQLSANPKVEVLAMKDDEFLRYDGSVKIVKDDALIGSSKGNPNTAYLEYSNGSNTTANSDDDTNMYDVLRNEDTVSPDKELIYQSLQQELLD